MERYSAWIKITDELLYVEEFDYELEYIALTTKEKNARTLDSGEVSELREFVARVLGAGTDVYFTEGV